MSSIAVPAQFIKFLIDGCHSVAELLRLGEQSNKGLKSVCALFVADKVRQVSLDYF